MPRTDQTRNIRSLAAAFAASAALLLGGCGGDEPEQAETVQDEAAPRMIERDAPSRNRSEPEPVTEPADEDFRVVPKMDGALEEDGMGLDVIIDASSKRAYADSLRWIAEDASKEQFDDLERSIKYIHMFDPSVFGNEERLLEAIDGKTGHEVIEHATSLMRERRSR